MFKHLIGNEAAKLTLTRLLKKGRVPNSLLFAGGEGVGKRQFALEIAKAFVCREPEDGAACGLCPACRRAEVFVFPKSEKIDDFKQVFFSEHPDVGTVIPFNRNILVDAIRDLEREANFLPYESTARFFIVDDAEKMNDNAANALLKTLEEPPPSTYIILVTSRPDSLLPTVRSRCQTVRFAPVSSTEIEEFLIGDKAFSRDEARLAARVARGSVGRAISISPEAFRTTRARLLEVVSSIILKRDLTAALKVSEQIGDAKNKDNFEDDLNILESLIHDIWTLGTSGGDERIVNPDILQELENLAARSARFDLPAWLSEIQKLRSNLIVNINRRVATDALFVTMAG